MFAHSTKAGQGQAPQNTREESEAPSLREKSHTLVFCEDKLQVSFYFTLFFH
jgi:hypothetical protein